MLNSIRNSATACLNHPIYKDYKPLWETVEKIRASSTFEQNVKTWSKNVVGDKYEVGECKDYVWGIVPTKSGLGNGFCRVSLLNGLIEIHWGVNLHIGKIDSFV